MEPTFSVVIPSFNSRPSLELVLRCLEAQSHSGSDFEVIVVDDGSTDGTHDFIKRADFMLHLLPVFNHTCQGRGAARNIGWKRSRGKIILFLDADTLPDPEWVADYASSFESGRCDVVSGGRFCLGFDPNDLPLDHQVATAAQTTSTDLFRSHVRSDFAALRLGATPGPYKVAVFEKFEQQLRDACTVYPESLLAAYSVVGANVAVRRDFLQLIRGFDQFMKRGEDTDLGIRLWEAGARFGFIQGANAYHQFGAAKSGAPLDANEALMFFLRHPYRLVLLVYLWFLRHEMIAQHMEGQDPQLHTLQSILHEASNGSLWDLDGEFLRLRHPSIPVDCKHREEELINYFEETYRLPPELIRRCLTEAVSQGLYVKHVGSQTFFDFTITSNWLRYRAPLHEYLLVNSSYFHRHKSRLLLARRAENSPLTIMCRGTYQISIDEAVLAGPKILSVVNIPLPIENAAQTDLNYTNCIPPDLLGFADHSRSLIPRYPWPADLRPVVLSYDFECGVREIVGTSEGVADARGEAWSTFLRPLLSPRDYPKAKAILKKIQPKKDEGTYELAKRIYRWVLDNTSVYNTPLGMNNILETGVGMCVDHARLFVNLCRLASIPARECCGAPFTSRTGPHGEELIVMAETCFSPFMHTWAECYICGRGWLPVEFSTWSYGGRIVTRSNVPDSQLREKVVAETELYDDYCFGNLDPFRIHASKRANAVHVSFEHSGAPNAPTWTMRTCLKHTLSCSIVFRPTQ